MGLFKRNMGSRDHDRHIREKYELEQKHIRFLLEKSFSSLT